MRFLGRREGVGPRAARADALGGGEDRRQRHDHALRGLQLRRPGGDHRRGAQLHRARTEEEFRAPPLRARDARPRPDHPHERRAAALELPDVAVRLLASCTSPRCCGRTSRAPTSRPRWPSSTPASAASGAADGEPPPAARAVARSARLGPRRAASSSRSRRSRSRSRSSTSAARRSRSARSRSGSSASTSCSRCSSACGRCGSRASSASAGWWPPPALGDDGERAAGARGLPARAVLPHGGEPDPRADLAQPGRDRARRLLDRPRRSPTRSCCAASTTAARSCSWCCSARSRATPAPTSAAARSAPAGWRRACRRTRRGRGWASACSSACGVGLVRQPHLRRQLDRRHRGAAARRRGRARRAARRPVRVADQARRGDEGHRRPVRRPRRGARPPRRGAVLADRRVPGMAGDA